MYNRPSRPDIKPYSSVPNPLQHGLSNTECKHCEIKRERVGEIGSVFSMSVVFLASIFILYVLYKIITRPTEEKNTKKTLEEKKSIKNKSYKSRNSSHYQLTESMQHSAESSDSESEELNNKESLQKPLNKENKGRKQGKIWRYTNNNEVSSAKLNRSSITSVTTKTPVNTNKMTNDKDIIKQGKIIGSLSIHPELLNELDKDQTKILEDLCNNGHVIEGSSKGKNGLIFLDEKTAKESGYNIKLKNCKQDIRFFAAHKHNGKSNDFEVVGYRLKHKDKKIVSMSKI